MQHLQIEDATFSHPAEALHIQNLDFGQSDASPGSSVRTRCSGQRGLESRRNSFLVDPIFLQNVVENESVYPLYLNTERSIYLYYRKPCNAGKHTLKLRSLF